MADIQFASGNTTGQMDIRILDNNGSPAAVVEASDPFRIIVDWSYNNGGNPPFAGNWVFQAFVESIGPGLESGVAGPVSQPSSVFSNSATLIVQPPTIPNQPQPGPPQSGVYQVVVLMTHSLNQNVAAFEERMVRIA